MNSEEDLKFERIAKRKAGGPRACSQPKNGAFGLSEDATEILRTVKDALRRFPEARAEVVAALERTEKSS